jgi:hypothetical protein
MTRHPEWTLLLGHESPLVAPVSKPMPRVVVWCFLVLMLASVGGMCRLTFFAGKYVYARMGLVQLRREHEALLGKIRFLDKLAHEESRRLNGVARFEDFARLKYGMNPISEELRAVGVGGAPNAEELAASLLNVPVVRRADSVKMEVEALLRRAQLQNHTFGQVASNVYRQRERWAQMPSIWPAEGRITSAFGVRLHPFLGYSARHEGLDIANQEWTAIVATADGIVTYVGNKQYYGKTVDIDHHGNGYMTRYAHMVQPAVVEGQLVRRGDCVGYMGKTGRATGTHLHYEVRRLNKALNPMDHILPDVIVD